MVHRSDLDLRLEDLKAPLDIGTPHAIKREDIAIAQRRIKAKAGRARRGKRLRAGAWGWLASGTQQAPEHGLDGAVKPNWDAAKAGLDSEMAVVHRLIAAKRPNATANIPAWNPARPG